MGIIGVSQGLSDAQNKALSPLNSVGTDIIVTRTVAPDAHHGDHDDDVPRTASVVAVSAVAVVVAGAASRWWGQRLLRRSRSALNSSDAAALAAANSSVITDLAKLGPAGTKFTHDFFVPGTLDHVPLPGRQHRREGQGREECRGRPVARRPPRDRHGAEDHRVGEDRRTDHLGERQTARPHGRRAGRRTHLHPRRSSPSNWARPPRRCPAPVPAVAGAADSVAVVAAASASAPARRARSPSASRRPRRPTKQNVVIPERTVNEVLNPPTTNTSTSTYTVAGVDPCGHDVGAGHQGPVGEGHVALLDAVGREDPGAGHDGLRVPEGSEGRRHAHHQQGRLQDRRPGQSHADRRRLGRLLQPSRISRRCRPTPVASTRSSCRSTTRMTSTASPRPSRRRCPGRPCSRRRRWPTR